MYSCKDRCKEQEDNARTLYKDSSLVGLWRGINERDTNYIDLRINGDYFFGTSPFYNPNNPGVPDVWYTKDNKLTTTYCQSDIPIKATYIPEKFDESYHIKNDTLFLSGSQFIRIKKIE